MFVSERTQKSMVTKPEIGDRFHGKYVGSDQAGTTTAKHMRCIVGLRNKERRETFCVSSLLLKEITTASLMFC